MIQTNICCSINDKKNNKCLQHYFAIKLAAVALLSDFFFSLFKNLSNINIRSHFKYTFDDYYYELTKYPRMCVCVYVCHLLSNKLIFIYACR